MSTTISPIYMCFQNLATPLWAFVTALASGILQKSHYTMHFHLILLALLVQKQAHHPVKKPKKSQRGLHGEKPSSQPTTASPKLPAVRMRYFFFFSHPPQHMTRPGTESELQLLPTPHLWQCWILNPLHRVRDKKDHEPTVPQWELRMDHLVCGSFWPQLSCYR